MKILDRITNLFTRKKRGRYEAAQTQRYLTFYSHLEAAHKEIERDLPALRAHSRDLAKNNAYMRSFIDLVSTHVIGPEGIDFENETPDEAINDKIEVAFDDWANQAVTTDGRLNWIEFQHQAVQNLAIDGEIFIRLLRGRGPHALELELIDPDRIKHTTNAQLPNGNRIIMGIEIDKWNRPQAYHLTTAHPADPQGHPTTIKLSAREILHIYIDDRSQSIRGIPWATPCMVQLNMLDRLWKSSLATANAEADRIGVLKAASGLAGDDYETLELDKDGIKTARIAAEITTEMATFMGIPPGLDVDFPPLRHPNSMLGEFTKFLLKGIASGLSVSYHNLAGDVAEANYSSLRAALLTERDSWRKRQQAIIHKLHQKIAIAWAEMAWLAGKIPIQKPPQEFLKPIWWPRSWDWVDPVKDIKADIDAIQNNLLTYQDALGKRGMDWRETFKQRAIEQNYAKEINLKDPTTAIQEPGNDPAPSNNQDRT